MNEKFTVSVGLEAWEVLFEPFDASDHKDGNSQVIFLTHCTINWNQSCIEDLHWTMFGHPSSFIIPLWPFFELQNADMIIHAYAYLFNRGFGKEERFYCVSFVMTFVGVYVYHGKVTTVRLVWERFAKRYFKIVNMTWFVCKKFGIKAISKGFSWKPRNMECSHIRIIFTGKFGFSWYVEHWLAVAEA